MKPIKTRIERDGQKYMHDEIVLRPKPIATIDKSLRKAFGAPIPQPVTIGHELYFLRWMKPDGRGGLIQK